MRSETPQAIEPVSPSSSPRIAHVLMIKPDGGLWAWGQNGWGQLGNFNTAPNYTPIQPAQIDNNGNWRTIAAGFNHAVGIKMDGTRGTNASTPTKIGGGF